MFKRNDDGVICNHSHVTSIIAGRLLCFSDYVVKNQSKIFCASSSTDIELIISGSVKHFYVSEGIEPYSRFLF